MNFIQNMPGGAKGDEERGNSDNAEVFLFKPLRPKLFFQFEININVLV